MIQNRFDESINKLMKKAASTEVALAISGGVDSISLLILMSDWAKRYRIKITVFSVNHNLRPESAEEIEFVKNQSQKMGHDFYAMDWFCDSKNKSALQERARFARYELMTSKCHELGISTLLTADHIDDMLENYIMRKRKKSGVFGLSYSHTFFCDDIYILRPLLVFEKNELINYLRAKQIDWREDSSNASDLYERNRVRMELGSFLSEDKNQLLAEMQECNDRVASLNKELLNVIAEYVSISKYGFAILDIEKIKLQCQDIKIQVLNYVLTIISGKNTVPRFRNISMILSMINEGNIINHSLHGCILKTKDSMLLIFREKNQINNNLVITRLSLLWDNRFLIKSSLMKPEYKIETLTTQEYNKIKKEIIHNDLVKIVGNSHKSILFTLPVIKNLEKIIAIPHIYYYDKVNFKDTLQISFNPGFVSRFTHFL